jgi:hypothetical protein
VNEEVKRLKRSHQEVHGDYSSSNGSGLEGNEMQRQQMQMTTIVANKIRNVFDKLDILCKHRDVLIADLQHKHNTIEEVNNSLVL